MPLAPASCPPLLGFMPLHCAAPLGQTPCTDALGEIRKDPQPHTRVKFPPLAVSPDLRKGILGAVWSLPLGAHFVCDWGPVTIFQFPGL